VPFVWWPTSLGCDVFSLPSRLPFADPCVPSYEPPPLLLDAGPPNRAPERCSSPAGKVPLEKQSAYFHGEAHWNWRENALRTASRFAYDLCLSRARLGVESFANFGPFWGAEA
jgi:hypothetical protein